VAVSLDDAHRWVDPAAVARASLAARTCMLDADLFAWHAVDNPLVPSAKPKAAPPAAPQSAFDWGGD
jgi:hypothetical protein